MTQASPTGNPERGIRFWMEQVVSEAEKVRKGFEADPVHDLRVAIRRCRSMAEGFAALDSDTTWKKMRRAAKPVFSALGNLRDVQVQTEWAQKLGDEQDAVRARLLDHFQAREQQLKTAAETELGNFDLQQWQKWAPHLEAREQLLPVGGDVFQVMALERLIEARRLQTVAMKNRSGASLHALRIGIKKLRYIVENFLPDLYDEWHKDLKKLQDLLGEVHDLDVLAATARTIHAYATADERRHWIERMQHERRQRIESYRAKMLGKQTLWQRWRSKLPGRESLHQAVIRTFEVWAQFRDPDVPHTQRVLAMSLAIFDQLGHAGEYEGVALRDLLTVAVLSHEVGRGQRKHHKKTVSMLDKLQTPPGWKPIHLHLAGTIARYHRGAMPRPSQAKFAALTEEERRIVVLLGGIIRLADALDFARKQSNEPLSVEKSSCTFAIHANGFDAFTEAAQEIASARFLLESAIKLPVIVRGN